MKDRWLNTGYHGDELQPHVESHHEIDHERVGKQSFIYQHLLHNSISQYVSNNTVQRANKTTQKLTAYTVTCQVCILQHGNVC